MADDILHLLGGIGLYLYGMMVMTEALRLLASRRVRNVLARFTTSPFMGAVTGMATTALIQSSSAVMVTTIGFVGAGLLTFPQSLGIIFGANIGTTVTGWMVMLIGLKLHLGLAALPLLFAASLLRLLGTGVWARAGQVAAGFSLIFLGLDFMQQGTAAFESFFLFDRLPGDTIGGRFLLLLLGLAVTLVVQASSAGVAMALVLLGSGTITLPQAAAMLIGMDIGTTFKSVLATLGGSRDMRRTAVAHVAYNIVTGALAFLVVGWAPAALAAALGGDTQAALVAFHTGLNVVGVALVLPFVRPFARLVERLVPGDAADLTAPLDRGLLADADAALDAAQAATSAVARALFGCLGERLAHGGDGRLSVLVPRLETALHDLEDFMTGIRVPEGPGDQMTRHTALLHRFDHLHRLAHRATQAERLALLAGDGFLHRPAAALGAALLRAAVDPDSPALAARFDRLSALIVRRAQRQRQAVLLREDGGPPGPAGVFELTDAMRWLSRAAHHAERIVHYGAEAAQIETARAGAGRPVRGAQAEP